MNSRNLLSAALAACVLLLAVPVLYLSMAKDSGAGAGAPEAVQELTEELVETRADLLDALERIRTLENDIKALGTSFVARTEPGTALTAEAREAKGDVPSGDSESAEKARRDRELVAQFLGGRDPEPLREFVAQVIDDEQKARMDEQKRKAEEHQREWQEFKKGPYGTYNYKVNSLGKKLGMDDSQKQGYYELLTYYREQFQEARKGINRKDKSSWAEYQEQRKALQGEFDHGVSRILTADQATVYKDLPGWQKNAESSAGVTYSVGSADIQWTGGSNIPIQIQTVVGPE